MKRILSKNRLEDVKKRYEDVFAFRSPDRIPVAGFLKNYTPKRKFSRKEFILNAELQLEDSLDYFRALEEIEVDIIPSVRPIGFEIIFFPSAFGARISFPENGNPAAENFVLENIEEVNNLRIPDIRSAGVGPAVISSLAYFRKHAPDNIPVSSIEGHGPLYVAFQLRGPDLFLDFVDKPMLAKKLLEICAETIIVWTKKQREITGQSLKQSSLGDNLYLPEGKGGYYLGETHTEMISPKFYRTFIKDIDIEFLKVFGGGVIHTCGNHLHMFEEFLDLPVSAIRCYGGAVDLKQAKKIMQGKKILIGVKTGKPGGVLATTEEIKESIEMCKDGGGYILGPDCYLEDALPIAKKYGMYN